MCASVDLCCKDCKNNNLAIWQCPLVQGQMYFQTATSGCVRVPAVGVLGWVWPYHSRPRSPWIPWLITQQPITFSLNLFIVFLLHWRAHTDKSDGNVKLHVVLQYTVGVIRLQRWYLGQCSTQWPLRESLGKQKKHKINIMHLVFFPFKNYV